MELEHGKHRGNGYLIKPKPGRILDALNQGWSCCGLHELPGEGFFFRCQRSAPSHTDLRGVRMCEICLALGVGFRTCQPRMYPCPNTLCMACLPTLTPENTPTDRQLCQTMECWDGFHHDFDAIVIDGLINQGEEQHASQDSPRLPYQITGFQNSLEMSSPGALQPDEPLDQHGWLSFSLSVLVHAGSPCLNKTFCESSLSLYVYSICICL